MITKLITNSFDFGEVPTQLVPLHSRGVDGQWLRKHAGADIFGDVLSGLRPRRGRTVIHVIALGDEEKMGPNRNCDGFSGKDNRTAHTSFKDIGHVFKHHRNDDPLKAVGEVLATAYNEVMSRIELLLELNNDKCESEVNALDKGEDVPLSMGSLQDFDVCSVCGHKAPTAADHCRHIKTMLGQLLADGRKIYMQNPNPKYFDISLVFKPADRIAYTLKKVAADNGVVGGHDLAEVYGVKPPGDPKYAALRALASMVKRIPLNMRKVTAPQPLSDTTKQELRKKAQVHGINHLLAFLSANGWLLGPSDMGEVMGHGDPAGCMAAVDEHSIIDEMLDGLTDIPSLDTPSFVDQIEVSHSAQEDLARNASMEPQGVQGRVMRISIIRPAAKVATRVMDECEARGFALLYGHYKLAFAMQHLRNPGVLQSLAATF